MYFGLKQTVAPTSEPVSLAVMKSHLRVTTDDDDAYINSLISASREYLETRTRRQFLTAQFTLTMDFFPGHIFYGNGWMFNTPLLRERAWEYGRYFFDRQIWLPRAAPLQEITSITYLDVNGDPQTLDPGQYIVDAESEPGRVAPAYNCYWPDTYAQINCVQINYTAGWTADNLVPFGIIQAIQFLCGHWYENRAAVTPGALIEAPLALASLIAANKAAHEW